METMVEAGATLRDLRDQVKSTLGRLCRSGALPALPSTAMAALAMARDPDADVSRLCRIVRTDVGITARLVRVANSAGMARTAAVRSVEEAVTTVGLRKACDILVLACARHVYDRQLPHVEELWTHALTVGVAAEAIAAFTRRVDPSVAFLPGLLHDVGRIGFLMAGPLAVSVIDDLAVADDRMCEAVEREWYGFDHAEAGAVLAREWGLDPAQCEAIRWHHDPSRAGAAADFAAIVGTADRMAYDIGHGTGSRRPSDAAIGTLGLSRDREAVCMERVVQAWERQRELLA